jgi:hypothetical protein
VVVSGSDRALVFAPVEVNPLRPVVAKGIKLDIIKSRHMRSLGDREAVRMAPRTASSFYCCSEIAPSGRAPRCSGRDPPDKSSDSAEKRERCGRPSPNRPSLLAQPNG